MEYHPRIERALSIWRAFICKLRGIEDEEELRIDRMERMAERNENAWFEMEMKDDGWDK